MRRPPFTLFQRLLLLTLPVECVVLALFGVWLVRGSERREAAAFDDRLRLQSQAMLSGVGLDPAGRLKFDAGLNLRSLASDTAGCILDEGGAVLWQSPKGWFGASDIRGLSQADVEYAHIIPMNGAAFRVLQTARRVHKPEDMEVATGPLAEVVLAKPIVSLKGANLALREKAVAVGVALLALMALLLWLAIGVGLKPVKAMIRNLSQVPGPSGTDRLEVGRVPEELAPLAREINGLLDRLWGLVQLERRFTAEAAHELRTPLTLVKSTLQTALLTVHGPEDSAKALQEALEDLQRLEATAESLLVLARADALFSSKPPDYVDLDLSDLLRSVLERIAPAAEQKGLKLNLVLKPGLVRGEHVALERLFLNLMDNAVKYTKLGGTITLRCAPVDGTVVAAVEDSGSPIPEAERPHLFEQFFRGAAGRAAGVHGAGLGLSIASAMARLHAAELTYEPATPQGNRFVVRFPRAGSGEQGAESR